MKYKIVTVDKRHPVYRLCHKVSSTHTYFMDDLEDCIDNITFVNTDEHSQDAIKIVTDFMKEHGFPCYHELYTLNNTLIEFIHNKSLNTKTISENPIHMTSNGEFTDSVTLCCYICNDTDGGGLNIYSGDSENDKIYTLSTKPLTYGTMICILFDEHTYHLPEPFYNGESKLIKFSIRKNK